MAIVMKIIHYPLVFFFFLPLNCIADNNCLDEGESISTIGAANKTRISPSRIFELGFFTADGSIDKKSKYLGIWYYNDSHPRIIVWVANQEKPMLETNVTLVIKDGHAKIFGINGTTYWSTSSGGSVNERKTQPLMTIKPPPLLKNTWNLPPINVSENGTKPVSKRGLSLCLGDDGNLILSDTKKVENLWHRFENPITDTFLPGMSYDGSLNITSWTSHDNPAQGNYTLHQQLDNEDNKQLVIKKRGVSQYYWQSEMALFDDPVPKALFDLLNNSDPGSNESYSIRLVMNFTGQIQFWKRESGGAWILKWGEPKDQCNLYGVCGPFASCNSNNGLLCKCLPGFKPVSREKWDSRRFSDGCNPNSGVDSPGARNDYQHDIFLKLPMVKVVKPYYNESNDEQDCKSGCLNDSTCLAYSCGADDCGSHKNCMMWNYPLTYLQEGYYEGITLFVRTTRSDIEPTPKSCEPCGAYIIPYPLSTAKNCGDVSYFYFHCNSSTGQVSFSAHGGTFNVTSIDPDEKRFFIQAAHTKNCDRFVDSLVWSHNTKLLSPFIAKNCEVVMNQSFIDIKQSFIEVEMNWKPPLEPPCNQSSDCQGWSHTACKATKGGQMRCLCGSKYQWDNLLLKCTKEPFPLKVVIASVAVALASILLCGIFLIYHTQKRKVTRKQGSDEFTGEDTEGIDVPFFDWESILAATNNFADENKLGKGGFGSVYKGTLPDGKEVAVKRLLSVSLHGVEEFRTEIVLIAKLQHLNLVRLLGYCVKSDEKILLYEFMPNGSLDSCLFDETHLVFLDWEKRFDIILGIARGLLYLHQDSRLRIIHRDLKPSNILLDQELNAKISDFGIARIIGGKETEGSTKTIVGTYGYMSPEYSYGGVFSVKSDVFSFGVVVLETISGRRNSKLFEIEFGTSLPGQAWILWNEDRGLDLMDKSLQQSCKQSQVLKCIHVGLLCVQEEPSDRPTMSAAVLMLSSDNVSLPPPKQPAFSTKKPPSGIASSSSVKDPSFTDPSCTSDPSFSDMITMSTIGR